MPRWTQTARLIVVVCLTSAQTTYSAQSSSTIAGVVVENETNQPLAGVQITLSPTEPAVSRRQPVITDAQGRFVIETNQTGRIRVVPAKNGFISYIPGENRAPYLPGAWLQVSAGMRRQGLELRMARQAVISGRVLGGLPRTHAAALLRHTYGKDGKFALRIFLGIGGNDLLNDLGEFRFYGLPAGEYYVGIVSLDPARVDHGKYLYYPRLTTEETLAVPIRVATGEEVRLGTLQLPPRQKDVELKVRVTAPVERLSASVEIGNTGVAVRSESNSGEKVLRVLPGHYDLRGTHPDSLAPTHYAALPIDVGSSDITQDIELKPAAIVTGRIFLESAGGERTAAPPSIRCTVDGLQARRCPNLRLVPKVYELDFEELPSDTYVLSVTSDSHDILEEGLNVTGNMNLEIVLGQPGAIVSGTVRTAEGAALPHASVALAPDAPYRATGLRYRSVITDPDGKFEIHGIAPGSYKLFAWPELAGAAYRNAEFMREFEERGRPVNVEKGARYSVDLTSF